MRPPNLVQAQVLVMAWRFAVTSYTPRPTRYLLFSLPSISLTSYTSPRIVPLPAAVPVTRRAVLTMPQSSPSWSPPPTSYHLRRLLLAIVLTASTLIDIDSSLCILQLPGVSITLRAVLTMP